MKRTSALAGACIALLVALLLSSPVLSATNDWHVTLPGGETFTLTLNDDKTITVKDGDGTVIGSLNRDVNLRTFEVFDKDGTKLGTSKRINPDALNMLIAAEGGDA